MSRQKHVFQDIGEIAHLWFHQVQDEARNPQGNFYFAGETIYSYGSHFPIATLRKNKKGELAVLLTTRRYSNTTAKHISAVRSAVHVWTGDEWTETDRAKVFHVQYPRSSQRDHVAEYESRIESARQDVAKKGIRAKTRGRYFDVLCKLITEANRYAAFFGERKRWKLPVDSTGIVAAVQEARDKADAKRKRIEARQNQLFQTLVLPRWKAGESISEIGHSLSELDRKELQRYQPKHAYLRIAGTEVQTILGATVPARHALLAYRLASRVVASGETWKRNGQTIRIGHYQVDEISKTKDGEWTIKAGCHLIAWAECERIAPELEAMQAAGKLDKTEGETE